MKKIISMFIFALFFLGLLFYVKVGVHEAPVTEYSVSGNLQVTGESDAQSSIFANRTLVDVPSAIQVRVLTQGNIKLAVERNNQRSFRGGLLAVLLFIVTNVSLSGTRSSLFWMLSICLTFLCVLLSQVCIIHQSDGKKRVFIF